MRIGDKFASKNLDDNPSQGRVVVRELVVKFHADGGGFLYSMPISEFLAAHTLLVEGPKWVAANFVLDNFGPYPGKWKGDRWNGWAVPWFTLEVVTEICKAISNVNGGDEFDASGEHPKLIDADGDDQILQCMVNGETLYGLDGWCWDVSEDD